MNFRDIMRCVSSACCAAVMVTCCNVVEVGGMEANNRELADLSSSKPYYRTSSEIVDNGFTVGSFSKEDFAGSCGPSVWIGAAMRFRSKIDSNQNFLSDQTLTSVLASFADLSAHPECFAADWGGMFLSGGENLCNLLLEQLSVADLSNISIKEILNNLETAQLWFHRALFVYDQRMEEKMEEEDCND